TRFLKSIASAAKPVARSSRSPCGRYWIRKSCRRFGAQENDSQRVQARILVEAGKSRSEIGRNGSLWPVRGDHARIGGLINAFRRNRVAASAFWCLGTYSLLEDNHAFSSVHNVYCNAPLRLCA